MELEIKPCPVCGGTKLQVIGAARVVDFETHYYVRCKKCSHEGPYSLRGDSEAKAAWNGAYDAMHQQETPTTRKTILDAAEKCVCQDRQDTHGRPEDSFGAIAGLWTAYLGTGQEIDPVDVANMMVLLKIARAKGNPKHRDNWIDVAGYAACAGEIAVDVYGNDS